MSYIPHTITQKLYNDMSYKKEIETNLRSSGEWWKFVPAQALMNAIMAQTFYLTENGI